MKKIISLVLMIMFTFQFSIPLYAHTPSSCIYISANEDLSIEARADSFVWKYKLINGVYYKRLYNQTKRQWVGDWIRVE